MFEQENRRFLVESLPQGMPTPEGFRLVVEPAKVADRGQAVVRNLWLSVDPYMRGRLTGKTTYAAPVEVGDVMIGGTVSQVVASNTHLAVVGEILMTYGGWQDYALLDEQALLGAVRIDRSLPLSTALGVVGMPGATGYLGLTKLGKPQPGETLVVSAAAGAVGSVVGQLGKMMGCRVIGIAGGPQKRDLCEGAYGFDTCIDYKAEDDLPGRLAQACPNGIDIYFENVGGPVLDAVIPLLKDGSRVPVCGYISQYNAAEPQLPWERLSELSLAIESRFFVVGEWRQELPTVYAKLARWVRDGKLAYRETVTHGLERAPYAFIDLFNGKNVGKQVVRIAAPA